jgi:NAD(P)-dependent dehydrogenase (short-subunit alcohol dehydrogenase family)
MAVKLWASRLAEWNIQVYEVRPGIMDTDMTQAVKAKLDKLIEQGWYPKNAGDWRRMWGKW